MDTIDKVRARDPGAFTIAVAKIRHSGTDNLSHFMNGYTHEGGLSLQQNPDEFAALLLLVKNGSVPCEHYLEIGSASGGAAFLMHGYANFIRMLSIDDGGHHRYPELAKNFASLPMDHLKADSHGPLARSWLESQNLRFGVVFIDGDHSYEGVWQDIELVRPYCSKRGLVILHDIVACDGVKRAWERGSEAGIWCPIAEYIGEERPLGIGVGVIL